MDTTLYVNLSHQTVMRRQMDVIANNIANMNTTAFKRENVMFHQYVKKLDTDDSARTLKPVSFVQDYGSIRYNVDGNLTVTNTPFDVALQGNAMFEVQKENGQIAYTRNGHFSLSSNNTLVTTTGLEIMGEGGTITIPPNVIDLKIASDGTISSKDNPLIGKLKLVAFNEDNKLKRMGENLFSSSTPPFPATDFEIIQGAKENSNVNPILEITKMIALSRRYTSTSKMISKLDDLESKSINRLAKIG